MTYLLLIIIMFIIMVASFIMFKKDLLSPSIISTLSFLMAIIFSFVGIFSWNTENNLSYTSIAIILIGIISFVIGELVCRKTTIDVGQHHGKCINVSKKKIVISVIFIILTIILMIVETKRVCSILGFESNNIADLLGYYRKSGTLFANKINSGNDINFIVRQMNKICVVIGIVFSYIYANNSYHKDKFKKINILLLPIALAMIETLLTSGRALFMQIAITFIILNALYYFKRDRSAKENIKVLLSLMILIGLFYLILPLKCEDTSTFFVDYVPFYSGWIGLILCQFIYGFVSSKFYLKVKKLDNSILVPIYGYFACTFIEQIRAEQFYHLILITFASYIIYFILVYTYLVILGKKQDNKNKIYKGEKLSVEDINKIQIKMLAYIDEICIENNIKYTLIGGSLIGAIRHKGMIPWDDDIDIGLLYEDYQKLIKVLAEKSEMAPYSLLNHERNKNYYFPFAKLVDKSTILIEKEFEQIDGYGVYVDIFCYRPVPNGKGAERYFNKQTIYNFMLGGIKYVNKESNFLRYFAKLLRYYFVHLIGEEYYFDKIYTLNKKQEKIKSNMLLPDWTANGASVNIKTNDMFNGYKRVAFEDLKVSIIKNYDAFLRTTFGDYMQLPPEEERVTHELTVYLKDKQ